MFGFDSVVVIAKACERRHGLRQQLEIGEGEEVVVFVFRDDAEIACDDGDVRRMREGEIQSLVESFDGGAVVEVRVRNVEDAQRLPERDAEVVLFHFNAAQLDGGTFDSRRHKKDADD